jgi:hypothetical protein
MMVFLTVFQYTLLGREGGHPVYGCYLNSRYNVIDKENATDISLSLHFYVCRLWRYPSEIRAMINTTNSQIVSRYYLRDRGRFARSDAELNELRQGIVDLMCQAQ